MKDKKENHGANNCDMKCDMIVVVTFLSRGKKWKRTNEPVFWGALISVGLDTMMTKKKHFLQSGVDPEDLS